MRSWAPAPVPHTALGTGLPRVPLEGDLPVTTAEAQPSPSPRPMVTHPLHLSLLTTLRCLLPPFYTPDPVAWRGQKGPGPAPATDGGWPRGLCTRQKPDSQLWWLDIEPGSFIYTVKVTSKFLRLERLLVQVVACVGPVRGAVGDAGLAPSAQRLLPGQGPGPTPHALAATLPEACPLWKAHYSPGAAPTCHRAPSPTH